jgi:hypothetical protein
MTGYIRAKFEVSSLSHSGVKSLKLQKSVENYQKFEKSIAI